MRFATECVSSSDYPHPACTPRTHSKVTLTLRYRTRSRRCTRRGWQVDRCGRPEQIDGLLTSDMMSPCTTFLFLLLLLFVVVVLHSILDLIASEQVIGGDLKEPYRVKVFHLLINLIVIIVDIAIFLVIYPTSPPVHHIQLHRTLGPQTQPLHSWPRLCPLAHFEPIYSRLVDTPFWSLLAPMGIGIDKRRPLRRAVARVRRASRRERRFRRRRRFPKRRRGKLAVALEK